jgi:hypothetical protein
MVTKRLDPVCRVAFEPDREAFGPVLLIFSQLDIQPVTGDAIFNENDLTLIFADGFAASGIIKGEYVFQNDFWAFFSHVAKIMDDCAKPDL